MALFEFVDTARRILPFFTYLSVRRLVLIGGNVKVKLSDLTAVEPVLNGHGGC